MTTGTIILGTDVLSLAKLKWGILVLGGLITLDQTHALKFVGTESIFLIMAVMMIT